MSSVVVVSGPIASGKSSVARAVGARLAERGAAVAVVDLDLLHDMLLGRPAEQGWDTARSATGAIAEAFLAGGVDVVIVDAELVTPAERESFLVQLRTPAVVRFVTLRVGYAEALRRARADPSRGISRDPDFLGPYYAGVLPNLLAVPDTDLVLDTEALDLDATADAVVAFVAAP